MQVAYAAGCTPPIYAVFNNGLVIGFAPGRTLNYEDMFNLKIIK